MKFLKALFLLPFTAAVPLASSNPSELQRRITDLTATTQNDVVNNSSPPVCRALTIIFARGTGAPGNVGDVLGPALFTEISRIVGGLSAFAVQGVTYSANILGFLAGGDNPGTTTLVGLINKALTDCPNTKLSIVGYSQGAQLVHKATPQLSSATITKTSSVVLFGDPYNGTAVAGFPASKVKVYCRTGDNICAGGIIATGAHQDYPLDVPSAAAFIKSLAGL